MKKFNYTAVVTTVTTSLVQMGVFVYSTTLPTSQAARLNALAALVMSLMIIGAVVVLNFEIDRHQKALEWFAKHVKRDDRVKKDSVPDNLKSLVELEDEEEPGK